MSAVAQALKKSFFDSVKIILNLYKVMLPILIVVKILFEFDLIKYVAMPLEPLMGLMGLPSELGLAWAAAMMVNLYSGLIVFATIVPTLDPLTTAQASVFALIALYAHSLPVEGRIAQQCGVSFVWQVSLRVLLAVIAGIGLHLVLDATNLLSEPATIIFEASADPSLTAWILSEIKNFFFIFIILYALLILQLLLDHFNVTYYLGLLLKPLLRLLGLSASASTTILVGMSLGLIYGSGLIIKSSSNGTLAKKDIFGAITLVGFAHAIIEDTALLMLIGGHWTVVLVVRTIVAIFFSTIIGRIHRKYVYKEEAVQA